MEEEKQQLYAKNEKCSECDFQATRKESVKRHVLQIHKQEFKFRCSECPKKYAVRGELNFHIQSFHEEKNLKCPDCDKTYSVKKYLAKHMKLIHKNNGESVKKYQCVKCEFKTSSSQLLRDHKAVKHEGVEPKCSFCDFHSRNALIVRSHISSVHKAGSQAALICDECGQKENRWSDFKEHLKKNHREKYLVTVLRKTGETMKEYIKRTTI